MGAKGWGWGKWGDIGQRVQTSSYKMNKFWGSNVQYSDYINSTVHIQLTLEQRGG